MTFTLDAYAARSCPVKTLHALTHPSERAPSGLSFPGAAEFTAGAFATITAAEGTVDLRGLSHSSSEAEEAACLAALNAGAPVIVGGLLPRDWDGHRRSRVELLIRTTDGYLPGVVKFQRALDPRRDDREFVYSPVTELGAPRTTTGWRYRWNWRWANAVQLAHQWELLRATGFATARPTGVVIGTDLIDHCGLVATWLDLTEPALSPTTEGADPSALVSALERYHLQFAERVDIAERALTGAEPPEGLLPPIVTSECRYCEWWSTCRPLLDDDDLSLRVSKSPLSRLEVTGLRAAGVHTVAQLADADIDELLPRYLPLVAYRQGAEDRLRLTQRRSRLLVDGLELARLTECPIPLPTSAVEIDIDIETSREDRVYLWGFWVRADGAEYYRHFSSFTDLDDAGELELAVAAMSWLAELAAQADIRVYHYSDYELVRIARLAASGHPGMTWASDFARDHFVDLFEIVRTHYFGANGLGLKVVAQSAAGFHWRDNEPGGLNSMGWFDTAVHADDPEERSVAQQRVLWYNEDDVRATAQLRDWLRQQS